MHTLIQTSEQEGDRQTSRPYCRQTERRTVRQAGRQRQTGRQRDGQTGKQAGQVGISRLSETDVTLNAT